MSEDVLDTGLKNGAMAKLANQLKRVLFIVLLL